MKHNIKILVEYDGSNYHGWQKQSHGEQSTIQNVLEEAIAIVAHERIRLNGSGRTDAGVHALGQVANFVTEKDIPGSAWAPAVNRLLPADIRIRSSGETSDNFHARYSAVGKIYTYRILNRYEPTALFRNYVWQVSLPLRLGRMKKALEHLVGKHDFSAFRASRCAAKNPVRTIRSACVAKQGDFIEVRLDADGFLQHMVRNIVGTLVETGIGRFSPDEFNRILLAKDRRLAGRTAPPQGLYLEQVHYPDSD